MALKIFISSLILSLVTLIPLGEKWEIERKVTIPSAFFIGILTGAIVYGLTILWQLRFYQILVIDFFLIAIIAISLLLWRFYRNPERIPPENENVILSPADGKIINISEITGDESRGILHGIKVDIFMSVFNVHVNRIPIAGRISNIAYHSGKFLSANLDKASKENENNSITLETKKGQRIVFVQIAGLIARRIACWVKEGYDVEAGQRFGLIRFGSRLDIYLPVESKLLVDKGNKVKAGKTILGYLP